jgi:putative copper resistance protein D
MGIPDLLGFGEATRSAVNLHLIVTGIQTGPVSLISDAVDVLGVAWYTLAMRRLARRGQHWSRWTAMAYLAGIGAIFIAVGSGLAAYDDVNVTMHVIQHVLLMMVAPPLIALGRPVTLATQAAKRSNQLLLIRVARSRIVAALTFPLFAWCLYYGTMYLFFLTAIYPYSVAHPLFHDATHIEFFVAGYLYWQPIVGLDPARWRAPYPVRVLVLFFGMPYEAFLGISVITLPRPLASINTLANTHAAGQTFWILSEMLTGAAVGIVVMQWLRQISREERRQDRQVARNNLENRQRAEELLGEELPEGVTVPWWHLAKLEADHARRSPPERGL